MEDILKVYKERLIKISSANRSLSCKKLHKKRGFDLQKLSNLENEEFIKWLTYRFKKNLTIIDDPYKLYDLDLKNLKKEIKEKENKEINLIDDKYRGKLSSKDLDSNIKNIKDKYKKLLDKEDEKLRKKVDSTLADIHSLKSLTKEISDLKKETGRDELYIGYPFVEGRFKDNTFVRAPLFLFPVSVNINGSTVCLYNNTDSSILLNKVFMLAYSKLNETKISDIEFRYDKLEEDFIQDILKNLSKKDINILFDSKEFEKFKDYTDKNIPHYNIGSLHIKNNTVLGQFPISNSIYSDYEALETEDEYELLKDLLHTNNDTDYRSYEEREEHGKLSFEEKNLYFVSNLDYSQEKAVKKASESKNLVIYGPPGTGKSQTIVNIISDYLAKDKKILMVSQKKAALDVIYNRLGKLNSKAIIIHDANKDKKYFYNKVKTTLEEVIFDSTKLEPAISEKAEIIDNNIQMLEDIAKLLSDERDYGISLQQMYECSRAITSTGDERYEKFLTFKGKNKFKSYKYKDIKEAINNLDDKKVNAFINYENKRSQNQFIEDINPKMNFMDIDELSRKVENIIIPIKYITDKQYENKEIYNAIMNMFRENKFNLDKEKVLDFAKDLNKKTNAELLEKSNGLKWWNISYWINYSKNKKQEDENKLIYIKKEEELYNKLIEIYEGILSGLQDINIVKNALNENAYNIIINKLLNGEDLTVYFENIINALNFIEDYRLDLETILKLSSLEKDILTYFIKEERHINSKNLDELLEFITLDHILEIEKENNIDESLKLIDEFDKIVKDIKDNIESKKDLTENLILNKWNSRTYHLKYQNNYKEFKYQANKKRALYSIRKYIEIYENLLFDLFPCFLLSPETVSEIMPLNKGMFDVVIFDEASQMYVESAIPSIFRSQKVIVAGDDKQLKPSSTFSSRFMEDIDDDNEEINREKLAALEEESLLDLAKINYDKVHLTYHYRSQSEELINFSNYAFYDGRLQIAPNVKKSNEYGLPIERIKVENGRWINNENIEEARTVVDLVANLFNTRNNKDTIGIITFNQKQKSLIEDMLEERAQRDEDFKHAYIQEIDRVENNEDVSLFVKNIENVQGDERDIIIFSIVYAKDENGRVANRFGTLNQEGGENRLNVAISRSKKKIYVVTSIEPEDLIAEKSKNQGPILFKKYLQYVRAVSNNNKEEQEIILNSILDTKHYDSGLKRHHDSEFEAEIYDELVKIGYEVHTQVGVSGYKIDLAIYDKEKDKYILGIECDGAAFHSSKSARERDIHRQKYLESRGWKMFRIWSKNWWRNPKKEIENIKDVLSNADNVNDKLDITLEKDININPVLEELEINNVQEDIIQDINESIANKGCEYQSEDSSVDSTIELYSVGQYIELIDAKLVQEEYNDSLTFMTRIKNVSDKIITNASITLKLSNKEEIYISIYDTLMPDDISSIETCYVEVNIDDEIYMKIEDVHIEFRQGNKLCNLYYEVDIDEFSSSWSSIDDETNNPPVTIDYIDLVNVETIIYDGELIEFGLMFKNNSDKVIVDISINGEIDNGETLYISYYDKIAPGYTSGREFTYVPTPITLEDIKLKKVKYTVLDNNNEIEIEYDCKLDVYKIVSI